MEVNPALQAEIKAEQEDPRGPELQGKIDGLKAAIGSPANLAVGFQAKGVTAPNGSDPLHVRECLCGLAGRAYSKTSELGDSVSVLLPPSSVGGVVDVCVGAELVGVVDGDDSDFDPRLLFDGVEVDFFVGGSACDDEADASSPVGEPVGPPLWIRFGLAGFGSSFFLTGPGRRGFSM